MGRRGIGARKLADDALDSRQGRLFSVGECSTLRDHLPWEAEGLSKVEQVVAFLEDLPLTQGKLAGTKLRVRPWQREFLEGIYREDELGNRPVRVAVMSLPRKCGKTQICAGLALAHLMGPLAESRGEIFSCANDQKQAAKTFAEMKAILTEHAELGARANILNHLKSIEVLAGPGKGSTYSALSADANTKLGFSPSFTIYDELGSAPGGALWEAMNTAQGAREAPLLVAISTQAPDDHHILSELIDYGIKVQSGEIDDDSFHLTFYSAPMDADPWCPTTWAAAIPPLGDFRSLEDVERQAKQARKMPAREQAFRNFVLNQRIAAEPRFVVKREWDACSGAVDLERLRGRECFGGIDLSATRDLTSIVWVFPDDDGSFDVLPQFFLPQKNIREKSEADRTPWHDWARQGQISLTPGATIDYGTVARAIGDAASLYTIRVAGFDRWKSKDLRRELDALGIDVPLEPVGQGFRDQGPCVDALERAIAEQRLRHGDHPVLRMCATNCIVVRDAAGNRKIDKPRSSAKVDGMIALGMALRMATATEEQMPGCLAELLA